MAADRTVFVFDLGALGGELDVAKMQEAVGAETQFSWGPVTAPCRIIFVTSDGDRVKVAVEIDAPIDDLDLGLSP